MAGRKTVVGRGKTESPSRDSGRPSATVQAVPVPLEVQGLVGQGSVLGWVTGSRERRTGYSGRPVGLTMAAASVGPKQI